jgi:hypothetical protein
MAFSIKGACGYRCTLSESRIAAIAQASNLSDATYMGLWDRIKNWFLGTDKPQALECLYRVFHADSDEDLLSLGGVNSVTEAARCFCWLKEHACDDYKESFVASVEKNGGRYRLSLSISAIGLQKNIIYGALPQVMLAIEASECTDSYNCLIHKPANAARNHDLNYLLELVTYSRYQDKVCGVSSWFKPELDMDRLSEPIKERMAGYFANRPALNNCVADEWGRRGENPNLFKEWVHLKIKTYVFFNERYASLLHVNKVDNDWLDTFNDSMLHIEQRVQSAQLDRFNAL